MRDRLSLSASVLAVSLLFVGVGVVLPSNAAAAQGLIFDWDGEKTADSGKTHVKFNGGGKPGEIVVSFADRKLYFFTGPGEADVYPVATPRDQSRWEGVTSVTQKRENPSWTPTAHMLSENPKLPRWVPGGHPMNPLGIRALYLGSSDYRIHGTDAPWTIGTPVSKGCVRMFNKDVVDLYPRVKVGTKVTVTWQKFDGKTFAIAETKGITELPAGAPPATGAQAGKPTLASFNAVDQGSVHRSKYRRPVEDDDNETQTSVTKPVAAPAAEKANTANAVQEEAPVKKRKLRAMSSEGEDATTEMKPRADVKEKTDGVGKASEASSEPVAKPERRVRTASQTKAVAKPEQSVETGSLAAPVKKTEAASKKADEAASLGVAEKALAAAERAAAAAERAAAAAERAVAAVNQQGQSVTTPAVSGETSAR